MAIFDMQTQMKCTSKMVGFPSSIFNGASGWWGKRETGKAINFSFIRSLHFYSACFSQSMKLELRLPTRLYVGGRTNRVNRTRWDSNRRKIDEEARISRESSWGSSRKCVKNDAQSMKFSNFFPSTSTIESSPHRQLFMLQSDGFLTANDV